MRRFPIKGNQSSKNPSVAQQQPPKPPKPCGFCKSVRERIAGLLGKK
jgi:hypothetical protein